VVLLHYAPVLDTVEGEPREIYPFLGSSRLEEPLNRYSASVVFHGHAHRGQPEGKTSAGVPVYNVALPLLQQLYPDRSPFRVVEIPAQLTEPAPPPVTVSREQAQ
jgi:Icc-related predicted phosphoesterase